MAYTKMVYQNGTITIYGCVRHIETLYNHIWLLWLYPLDIPRVFKKVYITSDYVNFPRAVVNHW